MVRFEAVLLLSQSPFTDLTPLASAQYMLCWLLHMWLSLNLSMLMIRCNQFIAAALSFRSVQAFDKLVTDLLHIECGLQFLCLPHEIEEKWDNLAKTQVAVVRAAYDCLLWESCSSAEGRPAAEVWSKLNPLIVAVGERNDALKALEDTMKATKRSESTRLLSKVIRKGRTLAFAKSQTRLKALIDAAKTCKYQVKLHASQLCSRVACVLDSWQGALSTGAHVCCMYCQRSVASRNLTPVNCVLHK